MFFVFWCLYFLCFITLFFIMKKIIVFVLLVLIFGYVKADIDWSICEKRTFTITAYYSPESDQLFYYKPNFEQEKILN